MKVKITLFFIFIFLIINAIYGQEESEANLMPVSVDTVKLVRSSIWITTIDTIVYDTNSVPYLSAEGIRFTDSLTAVLKNNFSSLLGKDRVQRRCNIPFFTSQPQPPFEKSLRKRENFDWFFILIFLFLTMLAVIRLSIPNFFRIFLSKKRKRDLYEDTDNVLKTLVQFILLTSSWTGFSLALSEVLSFLKFTFPYDILPVSFALPLIYFSMKYLAKRISGWIFRINKLITEHLARCVNVDFFWVLFAFLLVMINHYLKNDYLIWAVGGIFCINFLHKFFLACIIFSKKLAFLEILLYLCTLEILPILLFTKYLIMNYFYKN